MEIENTTTYGTLRIEMLFDIPARADYLNPKPRVMKRTLVTEHNMTREDAVFFFDQFKTMNADSLTVEHLHACWVPMPDWIS